MLRFVMAVVSLSSRANTNLFNCKIISRVLGCTFHISTARSGTHNYSAINYSLPQDKLQDVITNNQVLTDIRKKSGAVVRLKQSNDIDLNDEAASVNLLIVGSDNQIKKAVEYLNVMISSTPVLKDDKSSRASSKLIWHGYKRNFKGQYPPTNPRKKCIRCGGKNVSGNPCPLCQLKLNSDYDIHFTDVEILNQFICPHTWNILTPSVTGLCKKQQKDVEAAVAKARIHGYLPFTLPLPSDEPRKHKPAGVPTDRRIKVKMH